MKVALMSGLFNQEKELHPTSWRDDGDCDVYDLPITDIALHLLAHMAYEFKAENHVESDDYPKATLAIVVYDDGAFLEFSAEDDLGNNPVCDRKVVLTASERDALNAIHKLRMGGCSC